MWRLERYRDLKLYGKIRKLYPPPAEETMPERMIDLLERLAATVEPSQDVGVSPRH